MAHPSETIEVVAETPSSPITDEQVMDAIDHVLDHSMPETGVWSIDWSKMRELLERTYAAGAASNG